MVRRIATALVCALALFALPSRAVEEPPKNAIVLLPVARPGMANSNTNTLFMYGLEWEHTSGPTGFFIAPSVNDFRSAPLEVALDMGVRFYPFSKAPGGFFIGPEVGLAYRDYNTAGRGYTGTFRVGAEAGFSLVLGWFDLSLAAGGEYFRDYQATVTPFEFPSYEGDLRIIYRGGIGFVF